MQSIKTHILALLSCLLLPLMPKAQEVYISEPVSLRSTSRYELLNPRKGSLLLLLEHLTEVEIIAFDEEMHQSWTKNLELDRRRPQIVRTVSQKGGFSILYIYRKNSQAYLKIHRYNAAANLTDSLTLSPLETALYEVGLQTVLSEDRQKLLIYQQKFQGRVWAMVFDFRQMKPLWEWEGEIESLAGNRFFADFLVDNEGNMYVLTEENNRKSKLQEHRLNIYTYTGSGKKPAHALMLMPDFITHEQRYRYDNLHHAIVGGGLFTDESLNRAVGSFFLRMPLENGEQNGIPVLTYKPFDELFITKITNRDRAKGIGHAFVQDVVSRQDGGVILLCERSHAFEHNRALASPASSRFSSRFAVDYYFDEVFALSYSPDGQLEWDNILHKKQYSQNDEGIFSSYFLATTTARLRLLFNDEIRYENTVSSYNLTGDGKARRTTLFNTQHLALQLRFTEALQMSAKEIVIPSEKRNELKLVKVEL